MSGEEGEVVDVLKVVRVGRKEDVEPVNAIFGEESRSGF